jgi:hypothetical protein
MEICALGYGFIFEFVALYVAFGDRPWWPGNEGGGQPFERRGPLIPRSYNISRLKNRQIDPRSLDILFILGALAILVFVVLLILNLV